MENLSPVTIANVVGIITALTAVIAGWAARRKSDADAAEVVTKTALTLLEPLERRIKTLEGESVAASAKIRQLEGRVTALRHDYEALHRGAELLSGQVTVLGEVPIFQVPPLRRWDDA